VRAEENIFVPKRGEVVEAWTKIYNEEFKI
jgi:hypothetical protein